YRVLWKQNKIVSVLYFILCAFCMTVDGGLVVNCSAQNYPNTSCLIPPTTATLDLSHNNIEKIEEQDFTEVKGLRKLYLQFNQISFIDHRAFEDNPELEYLDISNNYLLEGSVLPFKNLVALNYLDISNNIGDKIQLGPQVSLLKHLQVLKLGNPQIISLGKNIFQGLGSLHLKEFHLITGDLDEYEHSLKILYGLEKLTLEVNIWHDLELLQHMFQDIKNATRTLQLKNADLVRGGTFVSLFSTFDDSELRSIAFQNISMNDEFVTSLFNTVGKANLEEISFDLIHFDAIGHWKVDITHFQDIHLRRLFIRHIYNPNFYRFTSLEFMVEFFKPLIEVSIVNASVFYIPCAIADVMQSLEFLEVSYNLLHEYTLFPNCHRPLPGLRSLVVDRNNFGDLKKLAAMTSHMEQLVNVSAAFNTLDFSSKEPCPWTPTIKFLNLRGNHLSSNVFMCLPNSIEILDLSLNNITIIANLEKMQYLTQLYLSGNNILSIDHLPPLTYLTILHVDKNKINAVDIATLKALNLTELKLSYNPFDCYCNINNLCEYFVGSLTRIEEWPEGYKCEIPLSLRGSEICLQDLSFVQCNPGMLAGVVVACVAVLVALCICICIRYNGPWYIKTIWIWIRAKKAPDIDLGERNLEYHAFLSYSEQDSTWVMNNLLKQLESDDPPYRICIHERDFTPGKAIIANIIDCISKSYKTVFVLSKNFVQSEWCHYEFFLAQHRVFEERRDSLILLLLEPIPANSIPDRFCKLRKMMNKSTYLEWPPDEACQSMFWKRLKAVLNLEVK
uniref:Toll-like receptor 2 n=1 Tax=Lepisosteus oculatus TaxID=7918 RepID=W5NMH7_LEPOC